MRLNIDSDRPCANARLIFMRVARHMLLTVLLCASWQTSAFAQTRTATATRAKTPVSVNLVQTKVVEGPDGKERFLPVDAVVPGDVIEYRATYRNDSTAPVSGMVAALPIPEGTRYVPRSASAPGGLAAEAATAEGSYGREPLVRKIKDSDGKLRDEPVPYSEYRMLRWPIGRLKGKGEFVVKARVQIEGLDTPQPAGLPSQPAEQEKPPAPRR